MYKFNSQWMYLVSKYRLQLTDGSVGLFLFQSGQGLNQDVARDPG